MAYAVKYADEVKTAEECLPHRDELVVLVGLPGAGKTTWRRERYLDIDMAVVSRDDIRRCVFGVEFDRDLERMVNDIYEGMLLEVVGAARRMPVVVDCTNLTRRTRRQLISLAHVFDRKPVAVVFDLDPEECWKRKKGTGSAMTRAEFDRLVRSYERVSEDEGFERVIYVQ